MFDIELRKIKDRLISYPAKALGNRVHPMTITAVGFVFGLFAGGLYWFELYVPALLAWILNRILDGLDGAVARESGKSSDLGGYVDIIADFFLYAAIPLVIALKHGDAAHFAATALLFAAFYVNAAVWMAASSLFEKRRQRGKGETSLTMPRGLIEGFETIVFYCGMLVMPRYFVLIAVAMAGVTCLGALIRFVQTIIVLRED